MQLSNPAQERRRFEVLRDDGKRADMAKLNKLAKQGLRLLQEAKRRRQLREEIRSVLREELDHRMDQFLTAQPGLRIENDWASK